ncbi:MAG: winged helix-turn-helix domain-containing protein [Vulcanimicrobiaceae bacterium]
MALEVSRTLLSDFAHGVRWVELASLTDRTPVAGTIAAAMGIVLPEAGDSLPGLVMALETKQLLLVVDNCEHVVDAVARAAEALLRACPRLSILATSRQSMRIAGETLYVVSPLTVPDSPQAATLTAAAALRFDSIALFADRARAVSRFTLSDDTVAAVAEICRKLDGLPLAIELAAPRLKMVSVEELDRRLDDRFHFLTGGSRTALPRQQTLRALFDWSYDLLSLDEQALFRRLGIYAGGWTLEAVGAMCSDGRSAAWSVVELLQSLIEQSLVIAKFGDAVQRYHLLESAREYALEKLQQHGEREEIARRHAQWYLEEMRSAEGAWGIVSLADWRASYEPELDNFRVALAWALDHNGAPVTEVGAERTVQYAEWAGDLALMRSAHLQAVEHFSQALEALERLPLRPRRELQELALRTKLGPALMVARGCGAIDVEMNYRRALALSESLGDPVAQFKSLWGLWRIATEHAYGPLAFRYSSQLAALAEQMDDDRFRLGALHAEWANMKHGATLSATIANAERGLRIYDPERDYAQVYAYGGHDPAVCAYGFIAIASALMGRFTHAREKARAAIDVAAGLSHPSSLVHGLLLVGMAYQLADDVEACAEVAAALTKATGEAGVSIGIAMGLLLEGWCRTRRGDDRLGIARMRRGVAEMKVLRSSVYVPYAGGLLATALLGVEDHEAARASLDEAIELNTAGSPGFYMAELESLRGTILASDPATAMSAPALFLSAIARARAQGAHACELRAALAFVCASSASDDVRTAHIALKTALASIEHDRSVRCVDQAIRLTASFDAAMRA